MAELLGELHWHYASTMVRAGLYPVIVSSFKCTPDACTLEYLRRLFEAHQKPYLVLELDEHDSSVGYETRIEAALRAFRNHHRSARQPGAPRRSWLPPVTPTRPSIIASKLEGKTPPSARSRWRTRPRPSGSSSRACAKRNAGTAPRSSTSYVDDISSSIAEPPG